MKIVELSTSTVPTLTHTSGGNSWSNLRRVHRVTGIPSGGTVRDVFHLQGIPQIWDKFDFRPAGPLAVCVAVKVTATSEREWSIESRFLVKSDGHKVNWLGKELIFIQRLISDSFHQALFFGGPDAIQANLPPIE